MHTELSIPGTVELYIADLDTHVRVENHGAGVLVKASRDSFSELRKASFIRHIASEGYISDRHEWFCEPRADEFSGVRWVVDSSWSPSKPQLERRARRRELGVTLLGFAVVVILRWWVSPPVF